MAEELKTGATYASTPTLSKVKISGQTYFLKDADARAVIDIIYGDYLKTADKTQLQNAIDALELAVGDSTDTASAEGSLYARIKQEITTRGSEITRVEGLITAEAATRKNADDALAGRITALETDAVKIASTENIISKNSNHELFSTLDIAIEKKNDKDFIILKGISGAEVASVDASAFVKDGMIENVELVKKTVEGKEHTFLKITFNTEAGKQPIELDVTTLIDVYTAGKGLELAGNEFSVKIDTSSEDFLSVSVNGVKLSGVQDAIELAAGNAEQNAKNYADGLNAAMDARVDVFEAGGAHDVAALESEVAGIDTAYKAADTALGNRIKVYEDNKAGYDDAVTKKHEHANKSVLDGIASTDITAWNNEIGAKAAIGAKTDTAEADTVYGAIKAGDAASVSTAANYTDTAVAPKADKTYVDTELAKKVDKVEGQRLMTDAEGTKLAGIAAGAQVNVLEGVQLAGVDLTITNKKVNITGLATADDLNALAGRVTTAEGDIDDLEADMAIVRGADTVEGSIAKGDKDTLTAAKGYTDTEVGKVDTKVGNLQSEFDDHTHSVTASGKITPSLNVTPKYLTATASGTAVSTEASEEFVKSVVPTTQYIQTAKYVNSVGKESKSVKNWTIEQDGTDAECLVFTPADVSWYGVGAIGEADAATGALGVSGTVGVITGIDASSKGTAIGSVSISAQPSIALNVAASSSQGAAQYVESVAGVEQTVNVTGTAAKVSK